MPRKVFVSMPTKLTPPQKRFVEAFDSRLRAEGLLPMTVGVNKFGNAAPLATALELMERCHGIVVLGLSQTHVWVGRSKPGTQASRSMANVRLATPWNQLEAGMGVAMQLPLFIVRSAEVKPEGILDPQVGDRFVHVVNLSSTSIDDPSFAEPLGAWLREVRSFKRSSS